MKYTLTVFTPTYNRAHTLPRCYESLKRQNCKDFIWLIVDDGSEDHTQALVNDWIQQSIVPIRYVYQKNQGMHGAHNTAYELIDTELNVCIDSDDYMSDDAVHKIVSFWKEHGNERVAGIVALDATIDGTLLGTRLPAEMKEETLSRLYEKHGVKGDKKLVYRTDVIRSFPAYPTFSGEKYTPLSYKYILIDQQYPLLLLNEVLCIVEYQDDGSSRNMLRQYKRNPQGFAAYRKTAMVYAPSLKRRCIDAAHYVSSSLMMGNAKFLQQSPCKWITFAAIPFGIALYVYIRFNKQAAI